MPAPKGLIVAALVRRDGRLLLVEEQGPDDEVPAWMLPGGRVEPGETLLAALARELAEETGLRQSGSPMEAFSVEVATAAGHYSAHTFECAADGRLAPADPDGFVLRAEWVATDEALQRLACVPWYDCAPLRRYLSGEAPPGASYAIARP